MAYTTTSPTAGLTGKPLNVLAGVARGLSRMMSTARNASSIAREVETLNNLTDEELATLGKTRAGEVDRIFARFAYL